MIDFDITKYPNFIHRTPMKCKYCPIIPLCNPFDEYLKRFKEANIKPCNHCRRCGKENNMGICTDCLISSTTK